MSNILFFTSFNKKLWDATGKSCIQSYLKHQGNDILICYEGDGNYIPKDSKIKMHHLDKNPLLVRWLSENADIIPTEFGGKYKCACPKTNKNHMVGHNRGCLFFKHPMRYRACHWIKKTISFYVALENYRDYNNLVWIDCDTILQKTIPNILIANNLKDCGIFYHMGNFRQKHGSGFETSVVGINRNHGGDKIIRELIDLFMSKKFRQLIRYDEAYALYWLLYQKKIPYKHLDLGKNSNSDMPLHDVSPFKNYIKHSKGVHVKKWRMDKN